MSDVVLTAIIGGGVTLVVSIFGYLGTRVNNNQKTKTDPGMAIINQASDLFKQLGEKTNSQLALADRITELSEKLATSISQNGVLTTENMQLKTELHSLKNELSIANERISELLGKIKVLENGTE